jgi:Tol biopolymer transport system component
VRTLPLLLTSLVLLAGGPGIAADRDTSAGRPVLIQPARKGPYLGQRPPGDTSCVFAPGVVSLPGSGDYACTWSPDGREFYFTRSVHDSGGVRQFIMTSRLEQGGWTVPVPVSFSAGPNAHEPHVTADGRHIYWGWFRPAPAGEPPSPVAYGIYAADRGPRGWSEARYVGQGMFVSSTRDGDLYVTEHVLHDGTVTGYLTQATLRDGRFVERRRITGAIDVLRPRFQNLAHPCVAPDGSYLVFDVEGGSHLCVTFRAPDGSWGPPVDLTEHGFPRDAGIASISPDGRYLFFGLDGDLHWVSTARILALRPGP